MFVLYMFRKELLGISQASRQFTIDIKVQVSEDQARNTSDDQNYRGMSTDPSRCPQKPQWFVKWKSTDDHQWPVRILRAYMHTDRDACY